jgi:hypothetical protein
MISHDLDAGAIFDPIVLIILRQKDVVDARATHGQDAHATHVRLENTGEKMFFKLFQLFSHTY